MSIKGNKKIYTKDADPKTAQRESLCVPLEGF